MEVGSKWKSEYENGIFEITAIDDKSKEVYFEKQGESSSRVFSIKGFNQCFQPLEEVKIPIVYVVFTPNDKIYTIFKTKQKLIDFIFEPVNFKKGWYFEIEEVK